MSDDGPSLKERQKNHAFMTTEEAEKWSKEHGLRPQLGSHWSVKAAKLKRSFAAAASWKRLAKRYRVLLVDQCDFITELEQETERLRKELEHAYKRSML